jgi:hypothetical protein
MNCDKFDVFVKIHRFFGLTFYGFYEKESKILHILCIILQLFMYIIVLNISSPCLLNSYGCDHFKNNKFFNNRIGFKQLMIYFVIRNSIGIASSIIFSIRGKGFRQIINDLRKLFVEIKGNHKNFKALNLFIIIFYSYSFIIITVFIINNYRKNLNPIISIVEIIGHFYIFLLFSSTDFFIGYFTYYLSTIQKLFENLLIDCQKISLNSNDIQEIKSKFVRIQSIIEKISDILSPLLFFNFGAIFYNIATNLYFIAKSIGNSIYFDENSMTRIFSIIIYTVRLFFYCLNAQRIKSKVLFF